MATKIVEPIASSTKVTVRTFSWMSLKDRKRMVLTIRKASATTTPKISQGEPMWSRRAVWRATVFATTSEIRIPAAPGMGSPRIHLLGFFGAPLAAVVSTLKRARRMTPQAR